MTSSALRYLILAFSVSLTACSHRWVYDRATNPVTEDYARLTSQSDEVAFMSTRAERRLAFVKFRSSDTRFCPEPPPDVGEAFARQFALALEGSGESSFIPNTDIQESLVTAIAPLFCRSQGIDFFRNAQFGLCVLYANGAISNESEYLKLLKHYYDKAVTLTSTELENEGFCKIDLKGTTATPALPVESKPEGSDADQEDPISNTQCDKNDQAEGHCKEDTKASNFANDGKKSARRWAFSLLSPSRAHSTAGLLQSGGLRARLVPRSRSSRSQSGGQRLQAHNCVTVTSRRRSALA